MRWFTVDFDKHVDNNRPERVSPFNEMILVIKCCLKALSDLQNKSLYRMQHDGTAISLEKLLNDYFEVADYNPIDHDGTKTVYIEDIIQGDFLFIHQDNEGEAVFIQDDDDDNDDDLFLDNDNEGNLELKFRIMIPDTYSFNERKLRDFIDSYRYIGTTYTIETYTL